MKHPSFLVKDRSKSVARDVSRPASVWLEIHRGHLLHNIDVVKRLAGVGVKVLAIIKANAYGHGLETVASTLAPHVSMFGVSQLREVLRLRECGIDTPLLLLGSLGPAEICSAIQSRSVITISSLEEAEYVAAEACRLGRVAEAHVKVDTGMGRLGIPYASAFRAVEKIASLDGLRMRGLYTHFPSADVPDRAFTKEQVEHFRYLLERLRRRGLSVPDTHLANSSGLLLFRSAGGTMVRPGLMLYGIVSPVFHRRAFRLGLLPTLAWRTKILFIKQLEPGDTCGYGRSYVARRREYVAWLPVGYSHGYPLSLSNRGQVVVGGRRYPVVGKVSMDLTAISLGRSKRVKVGDTATLLGEDGGERITVSELAQWGGTIPYEILTRIHPSIPRHVAP